MNINVTSCRPIVPFQNFTLIRIKKKKEKKFGIKMFRILTVNLKKYLNIFFSIGNMASRILNNFHRNHYELSF